MARPATKKKAPIKAKSVKKASKKPTKTTKIKVAKKTVKIKVRKSKAPKAMPKATPKTVSKAKAPKKILNLKKKPDNVIQLAAHSQAKKEKSSALKVGDKAPEFSAPATEVGEVSSESLKGKAYVLYFYPKDDTSGCTAEACEFRNTLPAFSDLGVTIVGISKDSMESHQKFSRKYNLNFPLLSDEATKICESFGTWTEKNMYGRTYMGIERSTFLVDDKGVIKNIWRKVSVPGHIEEVKKALEAL